MYAVRLDGPGHSEFRRFSPGAFRNSPLFIAAAAARCCSAVCKFESWLCFPKIRSDLIRAVREETAARQGHRSRTGGRDNGGKLIPLDVRTGDVMLFGKWSGTEV